MFRLFWCSFYTFILVAAVIDYNIFSDNIWAGLILFGFFTYFYIPTEREYFDAKNSLIIEQEADQSQVH